MYIGNDLQIANPSYKIIDDISSGFNGSAVSFALQVNGESPVPFPISTQQVTISVNGVIQEPDPSGSAGFKLLGSNIVFSSAPANGHAFFGVINAGADYVTAGSEFPDGSATAPSFTFQDDQDTGWYRSGSGAVGFSANGVNTIGFDGNGLTVTGDATFTGDSSKNLFWDKSDGQLEFADNAKAIFGTGSDLSLYHSSGNSFIENSTGTLKIRGSVVEISAPNAEVMLQGTADAALNLYHNGLLKFATSGTGATVTGTLVADGLTVSGAVSTGDLTVLDPTPDLKLQDSNHTGNSTEHTIYFKDSTGANQMNIGSPTGEQHLRIKHNTTDLVKIQTDGKVCIGGTSPTELLEVNSTGASTAIEISAGEPSTTTGEAKLVLRSLHSASGTSYSRSEIASLGVAGGDSDLIFRTTTQIGGPEERMRIDSEGLVGIGTNSGSHRLTVQGSGTEIARFLGANSAELKFRNSTSNDFLIYTGTSDRLLFGTNGQNVALTLDVNQNATFAGTVSDSVGELRSVPIESASSAQTPNASSAGHAIHISSGGVTINNSVFSTGDVVTIVNNSGSDQTITQGSGLTLYNTADATTGNRTLAGRGMATMWFASASVAYISGAGLS